MKLLIVSQSFPNRTYPIHSEFIHSFARTAAALGHEVKVLTVRFSRTDPPREYIDGIEVIRFPFYTPTVRLLRGSVDRLRYLGKFFVSGTFYLRRLLREYRPDLVDFEFVVPSGLLYLSTVDLFRKHRIRKLLRVNGSDVLEPGKTSLGRSMLRLICRQFDSIHFINSGLDEGLLAAGVPQGKLRFSSHGLDIRRFVQDETRRHQVRAALELDGDFVLLNVARMVPLKLQEQTIRALAILQHAIPTATLVFAGDGPQRAFLERLAADLNVAKRVRFLGAITPSRLPGIYNAADVFVFPILDELFAAYSVLEAASCGVPVVTNFRPEYLSNYDLVEGRDLVRFTYMDAEDLASKVLSIYRNPEAARAMANSCQHVIHSTLDERECAGRFLDAAR